jgi:hypothetical protein
MNLNKFTKAELISKIKNVESRKDSTNIKMYQQNILNTITNYFSQIWELIFTFKTILLKLTLISLIIKIIKKYSLIRKIWWFINSIGLSIYGLFLLDNFGFDFVINLFKEIRIISSNIIDYFSNTQFYTYLSKLFRKNEIIEEIPTVERTHKINKSDSIKKVEAQWTPSDNTHHRVSEWLKPQTDAYEEINDQVKTNDTNYNKYYIIAGMIVLACVTWFYADEVKGGFASLMEWIASFRAGPPDNGGGGTDSNPTPTRTNITTVETVPNSPQKPDIELTDNSKGKNKLFTSPSLDDLNKKAEASWDNSSSISPGSPSSTDSSETIKPSVSNINTKNYSSDSQSNINIDNSIELALLTRVNKEWKEMIPSTTQTKIKWIENNINSNDFFSKKQLVNYLAEIEIEGWNIDDKLKESNLINNLNSYELLQIELIKEKLNQWISEHHNKIFNENFFKKYK